MKENRAKKILSLFFAAVMLIVGLPVVGLTFEARAYDGTQYGNTGIYYEISNGEVTIIDAKSGIKTADIPESINGYPVTSIGSNAFYGCTSLSRVTIPDSVISIGTGAFDNTAWYYSQPNGDVYAGKVYYKYKGTMPKNTRIKIKNGTKGIAYCAFYECDGLIGVTIPDSVMIIDGGAFYGCTSLSSVTIPDSVKSIGYSAFSYCTSLSSVTIGNSVTIIDESAFNNCTSLTNLTIPNSVTSIGEYAFATCTGLTSITIPDSVTGIGSEAFSWHSSLNVYISDLAAWCNIDFKGIISTYNYRLYLNGNRITNLVIPDGVTSVSAYAFNGCSGLTNITIPDSVTSIGNCAFSSCPLTTLKIGKGLKSIGKNAFSGIKVIPELYYAGSEEEWKGISIDSSNDLILRANMHYNADLSHTCSYTETVTKKATCTEDGVKTFTCDCGRTYTETIQATGHKYVTETHKATCTSIGVSIKKCKSCGIVVSATTTPAEGHSTKTSALLTATETESGILVTSCETCGIITDASLINRIESVSLSKTSYTYNGKTQKPKVVVKTSKGKLLTEGKDYTVKYPKGMKNPGTYTVTITFKGSYSGKKTLTFTIAPKAPTLKVKAGAKKATLSWNKQTGSSGYVVYMATSKNGKYKKLATVKGGSKTSYTAAKLTKGKTVYFKVVSYTASGKTTVRSAYSKPVGAKIK